MIVKASCLTCEPSYMIVPNLARTCDGLAIGRRVVWRGDQRLSSRQHYETTNPEPMVRMVCGNSIVTLCELCVVKDMKCARD